MQSTYNTRSPIEKKCAGEENNNYNNSSEEKKAINKSP